MKRNSETTTESERRIPTDEQEVNLQQPLAWRHQSVLPQQVQAQAAAEKQAEAEAMQTRPRQHDVLLEILDWLRYILSAILIGLLLVVFVIQRNAVIGDSMDPTLHPNDQVLVEKVSKLWHGITYATSSPSGPATCPSTGRAQHHQARHRTARRHDRDQRRRSVPQR
jgi:hypothetical protein